MFCRVASHSCTSVKHFIKEPTKAISYIFFLNKEIIRQSSSLPQDDKHLQPRYNPINIQMLSRGLHEQIFGKVPENSIDSEILKEVMLHLSKHNLLGAVSSI